MYGALVSRVCSWPFVINWRTILPEQHTNQKRDWLTHHHHHSNISKHLHQHQYQEQRTKDYFCYFVFTFLPTSLPHPFCLLYLHIVRYINIDVNCVAVSRFILSLLLLPPFIAHAVNLQYIFTLQNSGVHGISLSPTFSLHAHVRTHTNCNTFCTCPILKNYFTFCTFLCLYI